MDFSFNVDVSIGLPNPIKYVYENIRDYVWEPEVDDESDVE
jgi:hypothetical protein